MEVEFGLSMLAVRTLIGCIVLSAQWAARSAQRGRRWFSARRALPTARSLQLLQQRVHLRNVHILVVIVIHLHHRGGAAGAEAFDLDDGVPPVLGGPARRDAG